jgi:ribosomal protein L16/L10AE
MGKGTGKLSAWVVEIPSGLNIFEFKNLRFGRAKYFIQQVGFKLPVKSKMNINNNFKKVNLPLSHSKKFYYNSF